MKTKHERGGLLFATKMALGGAIGFEVCAYLGLAYNAVRSAVVSALLISGILNLLTMLSYCELSAILPKHGGEYTYAKAAFGGFVAFAAGCVRWLSSVIGGALAALIFSEQLDTLFSLLGVSLSDLVLANSAQTVGAVLAGIIIAVLTLFCVRGTKKLGVVIVSSLLLVFTLFTLKGFLYLQQTADLESVQVLPKPDGLPSSILATAFLLQPFLGMRALVANVPQMEKPERNVPKAVILSTLMLLLVYGSAAYVAVSALPLSPQTARLAEKPSLLLTLAADIVIAPIGGISIGGILMAFIGIVVCISAISTSLMVQSSILFGMSRDKYLPKILRFVHHKFETSYIAIIVGSFFMIMFSILGTQLLAYAAVLFSILVFALVNLSVVALRRKKPYLYRPFKAPLYPLVPVTGIIISLGLFASRFPIEGVSVIDLQVVGGLLVLVLLAYYLRMVGRVRLKVAVGGISLAIGTLGTLLSYRVITYNSWPSNSFTSQSSAFFALVFISVISLIAGVLNINTDTRKNFSSLRLKGKKDELLMETTGKEELSVKEITRKVSKHLSSLVVIIGALLCSLSLWSIFISNDFLSLLKVAFLGMIGVTNIICGLLLLER